MLNRYLLLVLSASSLAVESSYMAHWTQYRLTEMFDASTPLESLESYFSETAWQAFQDQIHQANFRNHDNPSEYHTHISKFLKPIEISPADNQNFFAHTTFLVKFSNQNGSWLQPMELILTLSDTDGKLAISQFEGQTAKPIQVKNYALDQAKKCTESKS